MEKKKVILIIDDDPDILDSLQAIFENNNFNVVTSSNGREGIEAVEKIQPDLILCDMMMERIDSGAKVAQEIRKNKSSIPIYLLSSIGTATMSNVDIYTLGFNGVIQKPVDPVSIVMTIKKLFGMV